MGKSRNSEKLSSIRSKDSVLKEKFTKEDYSDKPFNKEDPRKLHTLSQRSYLKAQESGAKKQNQEMSHKLKTMKSESNNASIIEESSHANCERKKIKTQQEIDREFNKLLIGKSGAKKTENCKNIKKAMLNSEAIQIGHSSKRNSTNQNSSLSHSKSPISGQEQG